MISHRAGIVPRMLILSAIRVAEPWTPGAVVAFVALVVAIAVLAVWLVHRA